MRSARSRRPGRAATAVLALLAAGASVTAGAPTGSAAATTDRYHPLARERTADYRSTGADPFYPTMLVGIPFDVDVTREFMSGFPTGVPATATAVWARVSASHQASVDGDAGGGALLAHRCGRPADTAADGVLPFPDSATPQADVLLPVVNGHVCLSSTVILSNVEVRVRGWVDQDPSGATWVDLPDRPALVGTIAPASGTGAPLDLAAAGVPGDATAVGLWLHGTADRETTLSVQTCVAAGVEAVTVRASAPTYVAAMVWVPVQSAPCLVASGATGTVTVEVAGYFRVGATASVTGPPQLRYEPLHAPGFVAADPVRLFDTRLLGAPVVPGEPFELSLRDVPAATTAVALNVTATEPAAAGFVTVWPCVDPQPLASNLNFDAGQTVANAVIVGVGADQRVCFASLVPTHLVADLAGTFQLRHGDGYVPGAPTRLFDTRDRRARLPGGTELVHDLTGAVDAGTSAVVLNVTATESTGPGYVTAYPCGVPAPLASNLNLTRGQTVPNLVTVRVPADRRICFTSNVTLHLIADLVGSYSSSSTVGFVDVTPQRVFDTRDGGGPRVPAGGYLSLILVQRRAAWVMNATVTDPVEPGYLTGTDCTVSRPTTSNLNYVAGQTVPNLVIVKPSPTLTLCFYASGSTHVLADLAGFFTDRVVLRTYVPEGADPG